MERQEPVSERTPSEDDGDRDVQHMLREIERGGALPEGVPGFDAADAVLCALAMRLPRADADDLADVVPPTLRRIMSRCVVHEGDLPEVSVDLPSFLRLIATRLRIRVEDAMRVSRAVFAAVQALMPEDEIWDVRNRLPRDLDALWYPYTQSGRAAFEPPTEARASAGGGRPFEEPTETIVRELEQSGVLPRGGSPTEAIGAVLCTLAMELAGGEAEELAEVLPRTLRGMLDRCPHHRGRRPEFYEEDAFVGHVAEHLEVDAVTADRICRTVFAAMRARIPGAEDERIVGQLPRGVRSLWKP